METTMYDNLLLLPLFQGLSKHDFTAIIEKVKLNFMTFQPGEAILQQGHKCHQLVFVLNGEITAQTMDEKNNYTLFETLEAPHTIELHSLFGMYPNYTATYEAKTVAKILTIDKGYIFSTLSKYEIFRLNFLNILSNQNQVANQKLWNTHIGTLEEKIVNFLLLRCQKAEGEKTLLITMEDLSTLINETRIRVSRLLNDWQNKNLIQLKRKEIYIPALEYLIQELQK